MVRVSLGRASEAAVDALQYQEASLDAKVRLPSGLCLSSSLKGDVDFFGKERRSIFCVYMSAWSNRTWDKAMGAKKSGFDLDCVEILQPQAVVHFQDSGVTKVCGFRPAAVATAFGESHKFRGGWNSVKQGFSWTRDGVVWRVKVSRVVNKKTWSIRHETIVDGINRVIGIELPDERYFMDGIEKSRLNVGRKLW